MWQDWSHKQKVPYQEYLAREVEEQETFELYGIKTVTKSRSSAYMVSVKVNGHPVDMIVDTGAVVSIAPEHMYKNNSCP